MLYPVRYWVGVHKASQRTKPMRKSYTSILSSVLLGLLIPIVTAVFLFLPTPVSAEYPSAFTSENVKAPNTKRNLKELGETYPELLKAETSDLTPEFVKYDLAGLDLSDADLQGAMFSVSNLRNANLRGANLDDVIAYATRFDNADLSGANLSGSDLLKSNFSGANIDGADFTDALLDRSQQKVLCQTATGKTAESLKCGSLSAGYVPASEGQNKFNPGT